MKHALFAGCLAGAMLLLFAAVLLRLPTTNTNPPAASPKDPAADVAEDAVKAPEAATLYDQETKIRVKHGEEVEELPLETYLIGVLLGEMPPSFETAALEAQAVASRTFVLRQSQNPKHDDADVCTESSCCQAYCDPDTAREKLGSAFDQSLDKVRSAVEETDGLVITYGGKLIDAVYFSCSGGTTEAAAEVWGGDVPYLQSVESPGEEDSNRYEDTVSLDADTAREILQAAAPEAKLDGTPNSWFGAVTNTEGGGVDSMVIGGVAFSGTELRSLFSLRSTQFTADAEEGTVTFHTFGYGHRVGMSQYGAQAMAESGADFEEILKHYYTGVELTDLSQ